MGALCRASGQRCVHPSVMPPSLPSNNAPNWWDLSGGHTSLTVVRVLFADPWPEGLVSSLLSTIVK